jgi:hypothetical protein
MRSGAAALALVALVTAFWLGGVVAHLGPAPAGGVSRDLYAYFFPRYVYAARAVWQGDLPLWNPYELCGAPLLASAQGGVLNPFVIVLFGLLPAGLALHAYLLIHFVLAALLAFGFARALGTGSMGAAIAAAAWTLSPALTRSIYHPNRIGCLVWVPAVFWLGMRLVARPGAAPTGLLALALAAQAAAGYPEFALDTGVLLGIALACALAVERPGVGPAARALGCLALAAGLAVVIAAAQLLPTIELLGASARDALAAEPLFAPGLGVLPTFFRTIPEAGVFEIGMLPGLYVGAAPLLLAVTGLLLGRPRAALPLAAAAVACVLAVVGYELLHRLPIYRSTRFALPWALLLPFFTAMLAGLGWDALARGRGAARPATVLAVAALGAALFLALGRPVSAVAGGLAAGVLGLATRAGRATPWLAAAAFAVVVGDLWAALPYRRGADPFPPLPRTATTEALLDTLRAADGAPRFLGAAEAGTGVALLEEVYTIAGLEDSLMPRALRRIVDHFGLGIAGDDMPLRAGALRTAKPLLDLMGVRYVTGPARWAPMLAAAGFTTVRAPAPGVHGLWRNDEALPRAFLVRRVRVLSGDDAFAAVSDAGFRPRDEAVVDRALPALAPTPLLPGEGARLVRHAPEEVRIATSAESPALLVLTDTDFPGWVATVDGVPAPIVRSDFAFRGVVVPAGEHEVVFTYRPRAVRAGVWLSVAGLAGAAALLAAGRRGR